MTKKKLLCFVLLVAAMCCLLCIGASAADLANVRGTGWELAFGKLYVTGQLEYSSAGLYPWFPYHAQIRSIEIGTGVTRIGNFAFEGYENLQGVTYDSYYENSRLAEIGQGAFSGCNNLVFIDVPFSVASIEDNAFDGCDNLARVSYAGTRKQWNAITISYGNECLTSANIVFPATISQQPTDVLCNLNETATFTVMAEGDGLSYQWYYKNPTASKFTKHSGATEPTYSIGMTDARNGRQMYCIVTDEYGATFKTDVVTMTMPTLVITKQPENVVCGLNSSAIFTVEAKGEDLTYQWYYKNPGSTKFTAHSGAVASTYTMTMEAKRDGREMYCVIKDANGQKVVSDTVTMAMPTLTITRQPQNVECLNGETATFTVEAEGEGLTYQWYYKNPTGKSFTKSSGSTNPTYSITMTAARNGRQMYCVVKDAEGNAVKTVVATMTIAKPNITITAQPQDVECALNELATFRVEAVGEGLTYTWYYKNPTASKFTAMAASEKNTYSITMTAARNGRQMYCVVKDAEGNTVKTVVATMTIAKPNITITAQPQDVECALNELATFRVEAEGEGLTYTWYYKNPTASKFTAMAASEKNTYSITMTAARNGRQMYCVITDAKGNTVKTDVATMTIPG